MDKSIDLTPPVRCAGMKRDPPARTGLLWRVPRLDCFKLCGRVSVLLGMVLVVVALVGVVDVLAGVVFVSVAFVDVVNVAGLAPVMLVVVTLVDVMDMFPGVMFVLVALVGIVIRTYHIGPHGLLILVVMPLDCIKKCQKSIPSASNCYLIQSSISDYWYQLGTNERAAPDSRYQLISGWASSRDAMVLPS